MYFAFGILYDILLTLWTRAIAETKALKAALISFVITITNLFVYDLIITSPEFFLPTIGFALGGAIGSYVILKYF
jgi:ABC-type enterochelin transport system permease subunit